MLLKQHESSRLLQHKSDIDRYEEQLRCYSLELVSDNISDETKTEIENIKKNLNEKLENEVSKIKDFTAQLLNEYDASSFDDFMNKILNAVNKTEKIFSSLPDDLRIPFIEIAEKVKSVLSYLKSIF